MSAEYDHNTPFDIRGEDPEDLAVLGIRPSGEGRGLRIPRRSRIEPAIHEGMQDPKLIVKPNSPLWAEAASRLTRGVVERPFEGPTPQAS